MQVNNNQQIMQKILTMTTTFFAHLSSPLGRRSMQGEGTLTIKVDSVLQSTSIFKLCGSLFEYLAYLHFFDDLNVIYTI